jgi:hypothetical protein
MHRKKPSEDIRAAFLIKVYSKNSIVALWVADEAVQKVLLEAFVVANLTAIY